MGAVGNEEIIWFLLFSLTPDGGEEPTDVDWKMVNRFFVNFCAEIQLAWNERVSETPRKNSKYHEAKRWCLSQIPSPISPQKDVSKKKSH